MVNCGGLSIHTEYCFGVCSVATQLTLDEKPVMKKLLSMSNERAAFVTAATKLASESARHTVFCVCTSATMTTRILVSFCVLVLTALPKMNSNN